MGRKWANKGLCYTVQYIDAPNNNSTLHYSHNSNTRSTVRTEHSVPFASKECTRLYYTFTVHSRALSRGRHRSERVLCGTALSKDRHCAGKSLQSTAVRPSPNKFCSREHFWRTDSACCATAYDRRVATALRAVGAPSVGSASAMHVTSSGGTTKRIESKRNETKRVVLPGVGVVRPPVVLRCPLETRLERSATQNRATRHNAKEERLTRGEGRFWIWTQRDSSIV